MDEKLLGARVDDLVRLCDRTGAPKFLGFLSEKEAKTANQLLARTEKKVSFFGGYEGALRTVLCVSQFEVSAEAFPISAITFLYREQDKLSHRDFLGAVMSLGLTREAIGDILVEDGRAVLFAEPTAAKFILSQIEKVGRVGVTLNRGFELPLPEYSQKEEKSVTVASLRLDCVVSAICNLSRNEATEFIEKELVCVNSFTADKITSKIKNGDIISVRKKGKFTVKSTDNVSKKGRIVIIYDKYI